MASNGDTMGGVARRRKPPPEATEEQAPKPRPGYPIFARVRDEIGQTIERYFASKRLPPTLTSVVEAALEDFLASEGFPVPSPKEEGGDK